MLPYINKLEHNYPNLKIIRINADKHPEEARHMKIQKVPTMIFSKDGHELSRAIGFRNYVQLEQLVNNVK